MSAVIEKIRYLHRDKISGGNRKLVLGDPCVRSSLLASGIPEGFMMGIEEWKNLEKGNSNVVNMSIEDER